MKIFDMHVHMENVPPDPEKLLKTYEEAGLYGGCVFSTRPLEANPITGLSFEARLEQLSKWTKGYEDRLFPVIWIHPDEENIIEKVQIAADRGVAAFKMICDNYFVCEERVLDILRAIAKTGKPVIFHSGILYYRLPVSVSKYNRPLNWESLVCIEGLRFSMGHCSWPWIDECIAVYGRIKDWVNHVKNGAKPAEMFFDLTPGTPPIYREELLTKLYNFSCFTGNNILFGTDQWAEHYSADRTKYLLDQDRKILDKLGVSADMRNRMYYDNLLRFLGKTDTAKPAPSISMWDKAPWSYNPGVREICEKWYKKLGFPMEYDAEFRAAQREYLISDAISIDTYDCSERDGRRNLLSFLFFCEALSKKYEEKGIDEQILLDTLSDIVTWTATWSDLKGELYLGETPWLACHMKMRLFRLGSLQFCMGKTSFDAPELGVKPGDNVIEIHIPAGTSFDPAECERSIALAKEFFAKYYPDYKYECFTCHSWLLDPELKKLLKPGSNILNFQEMFSMVDSETHEDYAALRYVFKWNTTRLTVKHEYSVSSFAERLKAHVLAGGKLHCAGGVIPKN